MRDAPPRWRRGACQPPVDRVVDMLLWIVSSTATTLRSACCPPARALPQTVSYAHNSSGRASPTTQRCVRNERLLPMRARGAARPQEVACKVQNRHRSKKKGLCTVANPRRGKYRGRPRYAIKTDLCTRDRMSSVPPRACEKVVCHYHHLHF